MGIKILLVDDSSTMRRIQKNTLVKIGYTEIDEAEDGEDALKKITAKKYNLVLMDYCISLISRGVESTTLRKYWSWMKQ